MTIRLVDHRDVLADQVADRIGIPASHIEKDFWVTEVLRGAIASATADKIEIVFKGGTSLSKAFALIQRFSEDVDILAVLPGSIETGATDTKVKALVRGAETSTGINGHHRAGRNVQRSETRRSIPLPRPRRRLRTLGRCLPGDRLTRRRNARNPHDSDVDPRRSRTGRNGRLRRSGAHACTSPRSMPNTRRETCPSPHRTHQRQIGRAHV